MTIETPFTGFTTRELVGHKRKVYALAWNSSGGKLASGSLEQTVRVWTCEPSSTSRFEKPELELKGHTQGVVNLGWSPVDDHLLASIGGEIRLWDARASKCQDVIDASGQNVFITWRPDGREVAVVNKDDEVSIVDVAQRTVCRSQKFGYEVYDIRWSACGQFLFITTEKGTVEVRAYPSMELMRVGRSHNGVCRCAALDPSGEMLATGGADSLVCIWNTRELNCFRTHYQSDCPIRSLGFNHDSKYLAFSTEDAWVDIIRVADGAHVHMLECRSSSDSVAWNPKELVLAYAGHEDEAKGTAVICVFAPSSG